MLVSFLGIDFKLVIFLVSIHWINWSSFMQYSTLKHPVAYSARVSFQLRRDICIVHNMQLLLHLILCAWNCVTCNVKLSLNFTWELILLRLQILSIVVVQRDFKSRWSIFESVAYIHVGMNYTSKGVGH